MPHSSCFPLSDRPDPWICGKENQFPCWDSGPRKMDNRLEVNLTRTGQERKKKKERKGKKERMEIEVKETRRKPVLGQSVALLTQRRDSSASPLSTQNPTALLYPSRNRWESVHTFSMIFSGKNFGYLQKLRLETAVLCNVMIHTYYFNKCSSFRLIFGRSRCISSFHFEFPSS